MNNNFYELYQHAQGADDWFNYKAKASDTKIVDQEELDKAKEIMGEKKFMQEFECDWIANIEGAIYGDIIADMENKNSSQEFLTILHCLYQQHGILGVSDHSSIIFFQQLGQSSKYY